LFQFYSITSVALYNFQTVYIPSDNQAIINALDSFQINPKLVWDCHQSLAKLTEHNRIQLAWVPGHKKIDGNEIADQLTRQGSSHPLIGLEPVLGISANVARRAIRDWTSRQHEEHCQSIRG
jgi:ribonuclease HI